MNTRRMLGYALSGFGAASLLGGAILAASATSRDELEVVPIPLQASAPLDKNGLAVPEWTGDGPPVPAEPVMPVDLLEQATKNARSASLVATTLGDFELLKGQQWTQEIGKQGAVLTVKTPRPVSLPAGSPGLAATGEGSSAIVVEALDEPTPPSEYFQIWLTSSGDVMFIRPFPAEFVARLDRSGK
jgi:hypothetical protein